MKNTYRSLRKISNVEFYSKCIQIVFEVFDNYDYNWDGLSAGKDYDYITIELDKTQCLEHQYETILSEIDKYLNGFLKSNLLTKPNKKIIYPVVIDDLKWTRFKIIKQFHEKSYNAFLALF